MTSFPDLVVRIAEIKDRESLQLVSRLIESQLTMLEAQVAQLQQLSKAVEDRMKGMG
jgi:hypothetical protein